jgi:DNA-binding NarL/FixJ family response regulator
MLADDHPDLLHVITDLLRPEFDIVGAVADGTTLMNEGARLKPDVIITDISMPGVSGIQAGRNLLEAHACKAVVVLSIHSDPALVKMAFEAGIRGYVLKATAGEELIPAIHRIVAGGTFFSHQLDFGFSD